MYRPAWTPITLMLSAAMVAGIGPFGCAAGEPTDAPNVDEVPAVVADNDSDGVPSGDDCDDEDPALGDRAEDGDCDGNLASVDCDDGDVNSLTRDEDSDCDGVLVPDDCDSSNPDALAIGMPVAHDTLGALVCIPPGTFTMGCVVERDGVSRVGCFDEESPAHEVTLTYSFWMMQGEVTQRAWTDLMGANYSFRSEQNGYGAGRAAAPAEYMYRPEALQFANAMSEAEGLEPCYRFVRVLTDSDGRPRTAVVEVNAPDGNPIRCEGYRLPTEAEWEYAGRAGGDTRYAGSDNVDLVSQFEASTCFQCVPDPPCSFLANEWNLCDMSGLVGEWMGDCFEDYAQGSRVDPWTTPSCDSSGVVKGGFLYDATYARLAARLDYSGFDPMVGFRLVRTVP